MAAPVEVQIRSVGVDGVVRDLRLVKNETQGLNKVTEEGATISHSAARGLGELGRGLGQVAQSGELGAFALREFTGAAFRLGAEVGSAGLGAAIGLTVLAIGTLVEAFGKSGEAAKKAGEEFQRYIETLVHGSVVEASLAQAKLFSGDPTALLTGRRDGESEIAFQGRVGGQQYLEQEQARLQALVDAAQAAKDASLAAGPGEGVGFDPVATKNLKDYTAQLKEITALLNTSDSQLARVSGVYDELLKKEKELAAFQLEHMREKAGDKVGQVSEVAFGQTQRDTYEASLLRNYRAGLMGDQINAFGFGPKGDKSLFAGGQISGLKIKAAQIPPDVFAEGQGEIIKQWDKAMRSMQDTMVSGIADTLSNALSDAFQGNFAKIGKDAEAGLGGIMESMGKILVSWGTTMLPLATAFSSNPLTAAIEAIGIGIALEGLGKALGAAAQHGNSGAGYSGGASYGASAAYASQSSLAGQGTVHISLPFEKFVLDASDPDTRAQFAAVIQKLFGNREIILDPTGG